MTDKTKLGLGVLVVALVMGVFGDALLRQIPWGINLSLWVAVLVASLAGLSHWGEVPLTKGGAWMALPAVLFAAAFAWRDSPMLKLLDAWAALVALALVALRTKAGRLRLAGLMEYKLSALVAGFNAFFGMPLLLLGDIQWKEIPREGWPRQAVAVARGLALAVPVLLVFSILFMAADAVFQGLVKNVLRLDAVRLFFHLFVIALCAWLAGGYARGALLGDGKPVEVRGLPKAPSLGIIEVGIVLGLLDILFLAFVVVQVRYLFGGAALVRVTPGLTYAEYARHGFFELAVAAALAVPLLILAHWLLRKERSLHEWIFRGLVAAQILLLFVVMASAVQRMRLYQHEYGLTELRIYTTAFIAWLAVVFLWLGATVLRGQRERFAFGAMMAGFAMIAILHFLNPDALIARTNMARARAGRPFDADYATWLSADAVPALVQSLPDLNPNDRCTVATSILRRWPPSEDPDWRTWSWSRTEARRVVRRNELSLRGAVCSQREN